jgi:hypothetical protein
MASAIKELDARAARTPDGAEWRKRAFGQRGIFWNRSLSRRSLPRRPLKTAHWPQGGGWNRFHLPGERSSSVLQFLY